MSTTPTSINKTALGHLVANQLGISQRDGVRAVDAVLEVITRSVTAGTVVAVTNFGAFVPVQRAARAARNPHTGGTVTVPARQEVRFRVSQRLRETVQAADPATATIRKFPKSRRSA
ncbi:HU family DNA-binding protein [Streptomyces sp. NPDC014779]|uniref:HU family DNA-binding protein n=1 Tax=Streptomyces sp. NPDC014779 TaxID=3364911 RepID=UPI0036FFD91A